MSLPNSFPSGKSFHNSSSNCTPDMILEDVGLPKATLLHSISPTLGTLKRHVPQARVPIHSKFLSPIGTLGTLQSEHLGEILVNDAQQHRKNTLGSLILCEPISKSAPDSHLNTGEVFQPSQQVIDVETDIQSTRPLFRGSPPSVANSDMAAERGDRENCPLYDDELQPQASQESPVKHQELDDSFVPDPFITFQVIAEEFHINSKIVDPHGDIRRLELVTEIHQRWMKTLNDQPREALCVSPQQLPAPDIVDLAREELASRERLGFCSFCLLTDFGGSTDEDVVLLGSRTVDCCDECRDCQTFRDEYEWLVEASQAYCERYGGSAEASICYP